jgi:hypothetical protein
MTWTHDAVVNDRDTCFYELKRESFGEGGVAH